MTSDDCLPHARGFRTGNIHVTSNIYIANQKQNCLWPRRPKRTSEDYYWDAANGGVTNGGLRGVWLPFLEIGQNRPKSPFFCPFSPFSGGCPWSAGFGRSKLPATLQGGVGGGGVVAATPLRHTRNCGKSRDGVGNLQLHLGVR